MAPLEVRGIWEGDDSLGSGAGGSKSPGLSLSTPTLHRPVSRIPDSALPRSRGKGPLAGAEIPWVRQEVLAARLLGR